MEGSGVRRRDTTKGPPLRILSLDGGGVRGYSTLIILQELMHRTFVEIHGRAPKRSEIPKPCDHFDLIVGTGTGGLIALMLGRLRMNLEACKDTYVRLTKRVFETDKTIAGIPYRSTLFKASKLEEAIKECVKEHTVSEEEGNDEGEDLQDETTSPRSSSSAYTPMHRRLSSASRYSQIGVTPISDFRGTYSMSRWGKPDALLYDARETRTKTAVTAVLKGTPLNGNSVLLRSYDSRKETALEEKCTIWQAGRATSATALAFKPIEIGQSVFLDEGAGKYNPGPQALDEAVLNEWPGREVGVFVSIGTGKRPASSDGQQHMWWEGFVSTGMGDFAEARRRLVSKIEGCEETHQLMVKKLLMDRRVDLANYYRLNVDIGVGEFGMNEWNRLAAISTNTRRYLAGDDVQAMNIDCAAKLSRIHRANIRWNRSGGTDYDPQRLSWEPDTPVPTFKAPTVVPEAVELPAGNVTVPSAWPAPSSTPVIGLHPAQNHHRPSYDDKFIVVADEPHIYEYPSSPRRSGDNISTPNPRRDSQESHLPPHASSQSLPLRTSNDFSRPTTGNSIPPPVPPKTPIQGGQHLHPPPAPLAHPPPSRPPPSAPSANLSGPVSGFAHGATLLPYPLDEGPPPVNVANKPQFGIR